MSAAPPNISIVDDSDVLRRTFKVILSDAGYGVADYKSGHDFLDDDPDRHVDCILLDLEMPGLSGLDILGELNSRQIDTPVIVVTGTNDQALLAEVDRGNVVAIIKKPVGPDILRSAVSDALRG